MDIRDVVGLTELLLELRRHELGLVEADHTLLDGRHREPLRLCASKVPLAHGYQGCPELLAHFDTGELFDAHALAFDFTPRPVPLTVLLQVVLHRLPRQEDAPGVLLWQDYSLSNSMVKEELLGVMLF